MNLKVITLIFFVTLFFGNANIYAQSRTLDSLNVLLSKEQDEFKKIDLLSKLFYEQYSTDMDKALKYAQTSLVLSQNIDNKDTRSKKYISQSSNSVGAGYLLLGKYEKSLEYLLKALEIAEEIQDTNTISNALYNLSSVYDYKGEMEKSYFYLEQSIKLDEKRGDLEAAAMGYSSMADYYFFNDNGEYDKGLVYYNNAMAIFRPLNNKGSMASLYGSRAVGLKKIGKYNESLIYHNMAIAIKVDLADRQALYTSYLNVADVYISIRQFDKAIEFNLKSLEIAQELNLTESIMISYLGLSQTYTQMKNTSKALEYTQLYANWKDTLYNQENAEAMVEMQTKYDTEKKEKENELLRQQGKLDRATQYRQQLVIWSGTGGVLLILIVVFQLFRANKEKKKTNLNLASKNETITEQKKEITDSILYAKSIQEAMLPPIEEIAKNFADSFVLYEPRDVVSGDFYWYSNLSDATVISVADCTGHGVPGGFMSMMGAELLNQVLSDPKIETPGQALKVIDKRIKENLNKTGAKKQRHDGMDMVLCAFFLKKNLLQFAGANNHLIRIRNGEAEVYKAARHGVGGMHKENKEYPMHEIEIEKGDSFYLFTDGYVDQFGGPKGKKFMRKRLNELLLKIVNKPMKDQYAELIKQLKDWQGDLEQVDDICMIGIKI